MTQPPMTESLVKAELNPTPAQGSKILNSLRSPAAFDPVFSQGTKHVHGSVSLRLLRRADGLDHVRLGLIVPKKKTKLAVLRNAFKRIAREAARAAVADGSLRGCDVVLQFSGIALRDVEAFKTAARADVDAAMAKAFSPAIGTPARRRGPR